MGFRGKKYRNPIFRPTDRPITGKVQVTKQCPSFLCPSTQDAHRDVCGANHTGVCPDLASISTDRLISYLYKSTFVNLDGQIVSFDKNGDLAAPTFSIYNVQLDGVTYSLRKVGAPTTDQPVRVRRTFILLWKSVLNIKRKLFFFNNS